MKRKLTIPIDEDQRRRVRRDGIDESMIIEAGAGTGKTSLLVERITELYKRFDISEIVGITFTEKAAAELKDRVRHELEHQVAVSGEKPSLTTLRALLDFDSARLSTIHAFATSLIRERPVELGMDPDFRHVDDFDETELLTQHLDVVFGSGDNYFCELIREYRLFGGSYKSIRDLLIELYKMRDVGEISATDDIRITPESWFSDVRRQVHDLCTFASEHCKTPDDGAYEQVENLRLAIPDGGEADSAWRWLMTVSMLKPTRGLQSNWDDKENCRLQKQNIGLLKDEASNNLSLKARELLNRLIERLSKLIDEVELSKQKDGMISFQDQLLYAVKLLQSEPSRRHFRDRFERILIDEFQDTDPLQVDIAALLASKAVLPDKTVLTQLEPGRLTVVGDPKQSIYRFRRADARIYRLAEEAIRQSGSKIIIRQNFRSSKGIINFVNRFFSAVWDTVPSDIHYERIEADDNRLQPQPLPNVSVLSINSGGDNSKPSVGEIRALEADSIAVMVHKIVREEKWEVINNSPQQIDGAPERRPAEFGDIAILVPKTTEIECYTTALALRHLPYRLDAGKLTYKRQVVTDLYNCLTAVDNPADSLAVVGALRSRFFGINDNLLADWAAQSHGLYDYRRPTDDAASPLREALSLLQHLHEQRNTEYPDALIEKLLRLTGGRELLLATDPQGTDSRIVEGIIDQAREFGVENGLGLRLFRRRLQRLIEADNPPEMPSSPSITDQINLVTIHKSKGLEYPIVILANLNGEWKQKPKVIADRVNGSCEVYAGNGTASIEFRTAGYQQACESERAEQLAEKMRLLYVAMTRARDHLIIPSFNNCKTKGLQDWIQQFLSNLDKKEADEGTLFRVIEPGSFPDDHPHPPRRIDANAVKRDWEELRAEFSLRTERLKLANSSRPEIIHPSSHVAVEDDPDYCRSTMQDKDEAAALGRAFHKYMATCELTVEVDQQLIRSVAFEENLSPDSLNVLVESGLNSPVWKQAINSTRMWRETPILNPVSDGLLKGRIDLLFEAETGTVTLVDWKTGVQDRGKHMMQLQFYVDAVCQSVEKHEVEAILYFVRSGEIVWSA